MFQFVVVPLPMEPFVGVSKTCFRVVAGVFPYENFLSYSIGWGSKESMVAWWIWGFPLFS